jgi:hypothetical protein
MAVTLKKKPPHVCISLPAYTGQVFCSTMTSIISDIMEFAKLGVRVSMNVKTGNAMIADCRAMIVAEFLENEDFTHLVMIDSDVCWAPGSLVRLISHDVDFVCGLYPKRSDPITFDFRSAHAKGEDATFTLDDKGLMEAHGVPAGFICMKRSMLEKMRDAFESLAFQCDPKHLKSGKSWALFDPYRMEDGSKLGEDYAFCQRWRDIGGKVLIDPSIRMGHIGYKVFIGELGHMEETQSEAA